MSEKNWAGTHEFAASVIHNPTTIDEARQLVAAAERIRPLGTRHSFNDIADGVELISLVNVPADPTTDGSTVTVTGGTKYAVVASWLQQNGLALHNMGSLPHISVAGATSTATHGSGNTNGNLSTAIRALEFIGADGELSTISAGDEEFEGAAVALGALGPIARITLAVQPTFDVRQDVYTGLSWDALLEQPEAVFGAGYSVSVFTNWGETLGAIWLKTRLDQVSTVADELFGAVRETEQRQVTDGEDNMTLQGGIPGPWSERLPHFRIDATPSNGDEIQTEYLVALSDAAAALSALRPLADRIAAALHVSELRTVASDDLWLSTAYGRDSLCIHFTWKNLPDEVAAIIPFVEAALAPFGARPHWGKVHSLDASTIAGLYPKLPDFRELVARRDPTGKFGNAYLASVLGA
jgi:xylitol oxidase